MIVRPRARSQARAGLESLYRSWFSFAHHSGIDVRLIPVARIQPVQHRQQGWPAVGAAIVAFELAGGVLHQIGRELDELGAGRHGGDLRLAALFEVAYREESRSDVLA